MPKLNVNIDHVATLRQARGGGEPDPVFTACLAEIAGADGIVVHLREDRRHIQDRDLSLLKQVVATKLNMEMAPTEEMVRIALETKPDVVTLVPEKRGEVTTEGGLDVLSNKELIGDVIKSLRNGGIFVSLFINPEIEQIECSKETGADMIELHTGRYAEAKSAGEREGELASLEESVHAALELGLHVSAGHGLNYKNVSAVADIEGIEELNIGHSIISRSVMVGMERAVREMIELSK